MGEVWCTCWVLWAEIEGETAVVVWGVEELYSVRILSPREQTAGMLQ